jgi:putative DNA primase/helicase
MATLDQAIEQMYAAGMPNLPNGIAHADGKLHRYGPKGYGPGGRAYYRLYDYAARSGQRYIAGYFGMWGLIDLTKIKTDWAGIEPDEYQRLQRSQAEHDRLEREKRQGRANNAANRAKQQWHGARARLLEGEQIAYLRKKQLQWENGSMRVDRDGTLLIPMIRYDVTEEQEADPAYTGPKRMVGLQKIAPDGAKRFNKGVLPNGAACRFGPVKPKDGALLILGEGAATVLSAHQGLERAYACFCSFSSDNLPAVARILRALYPKSPMLILADDDAYLEAYLNARLRGDYGVEELYKVSDCERTFKGRRGPVKVRADVYADADGADVLTAGITEGERLRALILRNPGRTKAREAARAIGNAWVAVPSFVERKLAPDPDAPRLTDWNDVHVVDGMDRLLELLSAEIKLVEDAHELAQMLASGAAPAEGGSEAASGGGAGKGGNVDTFWRIHRSLLKRFTLINRSGAAWDAELGFMWRIEHMRLTWGSDAVGAWLGSSRRRDIDLSRVVFDPAGNEDPATTVNLFRGLETKPKAGECKHLLRLLRFLCGEDEATYTPVSDWVEKWCALQVQRIGTKMKTAIVMHGPEGTGKNLFWRAMLEITKPYSALIGQTELEGKFNTWQSKKLFIVANEVVTRAEMTHHVGRLKNLVTEDVLPIEEKFSDLRYEANHINLVFNSNEFQPLKISPGDRRYMIIRTPTALDAAFYKAVAAELDAGGAAAFMAHLLQVQLGDFNEHTKPILTEAKKDLVEIGMLPSQLFWQEIKAELVQLPYCPALAEDVYRAYTLWCGRRGHKMPEAQHRFTPAFMSMNGVRRIEPRVPDPDKKQELAVVDDTTLRKRRVFLMGERNPDLTDRQWIVDGIKQFRIALRAYEDEGTRYSDWSAQAPRQEAF